MERLRCGVILTDRFLAFLQSENAARRAEAGDSDETPVAIVDYVKCAEGPRAGTAYWHLGWGKGAAKMQDWCLFRVEGVTIYMSRQTQRALKWKHIDYLDGQVFVPL